MKRSRWIALAGVALAALLATAGTAAGASRHHRGGSYTVTPLVADQAGYAPTVDPNLINGWGISAGPTTPWWVSNQGTSTSTLYDGTGARLPLVVTVPGGPTGTVFYGGAGFLVPNSPTTSVPAKFMFATLSGTVQGWPQGTTSTVNGFDGSAWHAVYTGLAISGEWVYAADFANGRIDIIDNTWKQVKLPGAFSDWRLPEGYSPFGVQAAGSYIFVQYAKSTRRRTGTPPARASASSTSTPRTASSSRGSRPGASSTPPGASPGHRPRASARPRARCSSATSATA